MSIGLVCSSECLILAPNALHEVPMCMTALYSVACSTVRLCMQNLAQSIKTLYKPIKN